MNKFSIIGTSVLIAGVFFMVLTAIGISEHIRVHAYLETECNKPGTSCPIEDPFFLVPFGVPALASIIMGSYILAISKDKVRHGI